ncbi:MAG: HAD family hydrolase [Candidatus Bathyarchaeota archaeon]|jgi:phosphoglycolate phosphatase|nr:HAD family hydrolase [Candidatus Bathyarchaeota archaeon]MDP7207962.1 HAD family hydrolase [Candidatus Bathyarchaeota archaeon]MDP7443266.1 HAD family hydrolase [Candidatus Bathyarchaeota archaeon]|tara:strand:- start:5802 stop:6485 length:684 start_codon:yes stop_codon:yes gene_type:complete
MGQYKAVIFDLDGTLQDSKIDYQKMIECVRVILIREGINQSAICDKGGVYRIIRGGRASLFELGVRDKRVQTVLDLMTEAMNATELEAVDRVEPKPNALQTLKILRQNGILMGIATRSHRVYAERCLAKMGMRKYLQGILARDDVSYPKPDPRHLFETISLLNVNPKNVLFVGDTTTDFETARAAEVDFIGYRRDDEWGQRLLDAGCTVMAEDLLEVAEMALKSRKG